MRAGFTQPPVMQDHNAIGEPWHRHSMGYQDGNAAARSHMPGHRRISQGYRFLGFWIKCGRRLVKYNQVRILNIEATCRRSGLPLSSGEIRSPGPVRAQLERNIVWMLLPKAPK
jgi:hypothetical protein